MTHPTNPDGEVTVTDEQILDVLRTAYASGWAASGEGYNFEHPGKNFDEAAWFAKREKSLAHLVDRLRALLSATQPAAVDREAVADRMKWAILIDEHKAHDGSVDSFELADSIITTLTAVPVVVDPCDPMDVLLNRLKSGGDYLAPLDKDANKPAAEIPFAGDIAQAIHYPECWDTAAYPNFVSALREVYSHFQCSECIATTAPSVEQDDRAAFEVWAEDQQLSVDRHGSSYDCPETQSAWEGYRFGLKLARAASTSTNVAQGAEAVALPKVHGISRMADNPCALLLLLMREPTDDDLRAIHARLAAPTVLTDDARDAIRALTAAQPASGDAK
jgi:hypothetical protein